MEQLNQEKTDKRLGIKDVCKPHFHGPRMAK